MFSPSSLSVYHILPNTLHTRYLFLLANFYQLYSPLFRNLQQAAENFDNLIIQQPAEKSNSPNHPDVQDDFELLFSIPWSHHQKIMNIQKKLNNRPGEKLNFDTPKFCFFEHFY